MMKNSFRWVLYCLFFACITGCAVLAASAGVGVGYYVAKDDREPKEILSDASITASINAKYIKDREVSALNVNVDTRHGVVTLYGSVDKAATEDRAIQLASEVEGVKKIISKMTVLEKSLE